MTRGFLLGFGCSILRSVGRAGRREEVGRRGHTGVGGGQRAGLGWEERSGRQGWDPTVMLDLNAAS